MNVVTNHLLFNHTDLRRLQADASNDTAAAQVAQRVRDRLPARQTSSLPALIDSWVGPVLDGLGFHHTPDADAPHVHRLYAAPGDTTPVGLCYVVAPGQDLDSTLKGRHPMAGAVLALRQRGLRWGMLTDGTRWRLLDAQALRRYEQYLEVNLDALASADEPAGARLFYAVFHRRAFAPNADGATGLDALEAASRQATKVVEAHLKARVSRSDGVMAQLCRGLVRATGKAALTAAERAAIYRDATTLLYRVLFILYAEARALLPVEHPAYAEASLRSLSRLARTYQTVGLPDPDATTLWERLKRLCAAIHGGDPCVGVPAYGGQLFDDGDKPYLRAGYIADAYLARALFELTTLPDGDAPDGCRDIDYRDLSVRHLGSLYEGMTETRLFIAEAPMLARRDDTGNVHYLAQAEAGAPQRTDHVLAAGDVYFAQTREERRATGAYYTPEYVVDFIVRQTVGQGLEERRAGLAARLAQGQADIASAPDEPERRRRQGIADAELVRFVEDEVLRFKVCDPALGSGHFLVNAAHQVTAFIVETLHATAWPNPAIDADPVAWRRRVVAECLYGADLDPMAVEVAKLSLWLAALAEGTPLSFLDHPIRQGNSLIDGHLPDRLAPGEGGFDAVIGNPPWGGAIDAAQAAHYRRLYPATTRAGMDTYKLFVERALGLWNARGSFAFILPSTFLTQLTYRDLRQTILSQAHLTCLVDLGDGVFPGVTAPACIVGLSRQPQDEVRYLSLKQLKDKAAHLDDPPARISSLVYHKLPDTLFVVEDPPTTELLLRLLTEYPRLGDAREYRIRDVGMNYNRSAVAGKVFYTGRQQDPRDYPRIKGGNFHRYTDVGQAGWLRHDYRSLLSEGEALSVRDDVYALPRKLIVRQTADTLIATLDTSRQYLGRSVIAITEEGAQPLEFLLAVFNSRLLAWVYALLSQEEHRALAQVKVNKVEKLPLPPVAFATSPATRSQLAAEGQSLYEGYVATGDPTGIMAFVQRRIAQAPPQTAVLYDLLVFLAQQMLATQRQKHAALTAFASWLEQELGVSPDTLRHRARLQDPVGHGRSGRPPLRFAELMDILHQNRRRIPVALTDTALQARLQAGYADALVALVAHAERLAATDRLIDQVVYRLYGLSDAEISLVDRCE